MNYPFVSIIMPIRNEEDFITRSLGAVLNQSYPAERIEILIADGLSDDNTLNVIQAMPEAGRVHIFSNPRRIQAAGLNEAIRRSQGEYIIRVDGHTVIAHDYVEQCVQALQITAAQNVGGPMDPIGMTPMGQAIAAAGKSVFAVPSTFHVSQHAQFTDTVYMGAWPREVFATVGLYNEEYSVNEDYELNYRIRKTGGKIYFSPTIRSQYFGRQTLSSLASQYFRYGFSKVRTLREHPQSLKPRQLAAPLFVAGAVGGILPAFFSNTLRSLWLMGLIAYFGLNLFFSMRVVARNDRRLFWQLPIIFLTIHMMWGLGFLAGLVRSDSQSIGTPTYKP